MKEHAGGTPNVGHIPLDSWEAESFVVPVEHFDFDAVDDPVDFFLEAIHKGESRDYLRSMFAALVQKWAATDTAIKIATLLALIIEADEPRMLAESVVWGTGMSLSGGATISEIATEYGVSRQAVDQMANRACERLKMRKCRTMRDEKARKTMSERNYRRPKNAAATDSN